MNKRAIKLEIYISFIALFRMGKVIYSFLQDMYAFYNSLFNALNVILTPLSSILTLH